MCSKLLNKNQENRFVDTALHSKRQFTPLTIQRTICTDVADDINDWLIKY